MYLTLNGAMTSYANSRVYTADSSAYISTADLGAGWVQKNKSELIRVGLIPLGLPPASFAASDHLLPLLHWNTIPSQYLGNIQHSAQDALPPSAREHHRYAVFAGSLHAVCVV